VDCASSVVGISCHKLESISETQRLNGVHHLYNSAVGTKPFMPPSSLKKGTGPVSLPTSAIIATSSLRRRAQLLHRRPDLKLIDMRGNVETRLRKLMDQDLDAIILAEAGLVRLGLADQITEVLDRAWMLPAVGQGALGLECRTDDSETRALVERLNHGETRAAVLAERAMLRGLGGGCQVPIGAATSVAHGMLTLRGVVLPPDGSKRVEAEIAGPLDRGESLGERLAQQLLARGAHALLQQH